MYGVSHLLNAIRVTPRGVHRCMVSGSHVVLRCPLMINRKANAVADLAAYGRDKAKSSIGVMEHSKVLLATRRTYNDYQLEITGGISKFVIVVTPDIIPTESA